MAEVERQTIKYGNVPKCLSGAISSIEFVERAQYKKDSDQKELHYNFAPGWTNVNKMNPAQFTATPPTIIEMVTEAVKELPFFTNDVVLHLIDKYERVTDTTLKTKQW